MRQTDDKFNFLCKKKCSWDDSTQDVTFWQKKLKKVQKLHNIVTSNFLCCSYTYEGLNLYLYYNYYNLYFQKLKHPNKIF